MCDNNQVADKKIFFSDDLGEEKELKHENRYRRWVCTEQVDQDGRYGKTAAGKKARSNEMKETYRVFRHYDDKAIDAMISMAAIAETRMATLSSQRIQVTLVNSAICAGILTFMPARIEALESALSNVSFEVTFFAPFVMSLIFWIIIKTIGVTEVYYYKIVSRTFYAAAKHYRISLPLSAANIAYRDEMGWMRPLLRNHTFRVFEWINLLLPLGAWTLIYLTYYKI